MCGCTVFCELWYLNVCVRGLQVMSAHIFVNFIFLVIRGKDELYVLSLESVTSIKKPINPLKLVYHPVSCLLHHYIDINVLDYLQVNNNHSSKWTWYLSSVFIGKFGNNYNITNKHIWWELYLDFYTFKKKQLFLKTYLKISVYLILKELVIISFKWFFLH